MPENGHPIPFLDLKRQHQFLLPELEQAFRDIITQTMFVGGKYVEEFEAQFARYLSVSHVIGVGNGTDALYYALKSLHIGPGDEVLVPAFTFIATWEAVSLTGATPVPVEVDPRTFTMDPSAIPSRVTPRTRAIIPVHIYGNVADMDGIIEMAERFQLWVIEDAAQAQGAECLTHYEPGFNGKWKRMDSPKWKKAGSIGHIGCFSFYPGKNLGACGDAGAIATSNPSLGDTIRLLRDHGSPSKYHHQIVGGNSRLDSMQAAFLLIKLKYLDQWNAKRREIAAIYNQAFRPVQGIRLMEIPSYSRPVYHIYPILVENRDVTVERLKTQQIYCGIHYPIPNHLQPAYSHLGYVRGTFPAAERIFFEEISLPMFAELTEEEIQTVVQAVLSCVK